MSALIAVLGALHVGSVLVFRREKAMLDQVAPPGAVFRSGRL